MLWWYRIADRQGKPLWQVQQEITPNEFHHWVAFLEEEETRLTPDQFYLAQIAAEVRRSRVTKPNLVKIEDLIIKFQTKQREKPVEMMTEQEIADKIARSKAIWKAHMSNRKNPKQKVKK